MMNREEAIKIAGEEAVNTTPAEIEAAGDDLGNVAWQIDSYEVR